MFLEFVSENIWWFVGFITVLNLILFSFIQGSVKGASWVTAIQLPKLQRAGKSVIFDLNDAATFEKGHIAGATNLKIADISKENKKLLKHKNDTTILVCQNGSESQKAARGLVALGFSNINMLKGGLFAWQKENLPLVTGS